MRTAWIMVGITVLLMVGQVEAGYLYTADNLQTTGAPYGYEITGTNVLYAPGEIVRVTGTGFGNRDLDDGIPEMIYVRPPDHNLFMIFRGSRYESTQVYYGLLSWTDTEITMEVRPEMSPLLGSFIILRQYRDYNDNLGVCTRGDMTLIPEPSALLLVLCGGLLLKRR